MSRDRPEGRSRDVESADDAEDDLSLPWDKGDAHWHAAAHDKEARDTLDVDDDVPWDELAEDTAPTFEEATFAARSSRLVPDNDDDDESGPQPDDEAPPHGDPLEQKADELFEPDRPATRMDSLQDALASIRERVQTLSGEAQVGATRTRAAQSSQLALYRAATDDRTLAELRRHGRDTEDLLRRMSALMQDLSLDMRSIVDAARRAIDQTSEQAESSIELGRLLGERIEQMDDQLSARMAALEQAPRAEKTVARQVDQIDAAIGTLQDHLDKRLTRLEQRSGVGVLREEMSEVRSDLGEVRVDLSDMRTELTTLHDEVGAGGNGGGVDLQQRLEVVGGQLDRTLAILRDLTEVGPDQAAEAVEGVVGGVESFRQEVEELSHQLSDALGREEQLTTALGTLTDEVQRLRKRIAVRAAPPTMDDEQIQTIVDAVVVAVQGRRPPSVRRRPTEPAPGDEAPDVEAEPARPAAKASRKRTPRRAAARKAAARQEPDDEVDINEPFAPGELDVDESNLDVEPEEEPIRRARGDKKKASKPLTKGRRTRSSSR